MYKVIHIIFSLISTVQCTHIHTQVHKYTVHICTVMSSPKIDIPLTSKNSEASGSRSRPLRPLVNVEKTGDSLGKPDVAVTCTNQM
ncbi:hypothetical protein BDV35DRAFT_344091, partial [Aspergillus flavus]